MNDSDCHCGRNNGFFSGLLFGALITGGLVYFLTSTKKGKEIKKQLREKGEDALDYLADLVDEVEEKGKQFKDKAKAVQTELEEKASSLKQEVVKEAQEGLSQIDQLQERGRQAVKFFTRNGKPLV